MSQGASFHSAELRCHEDGGTIWTGQGSPVMKESGIETDRMKIDVSTSETKLNPTDFHAIFPESLNLISLKLCENCSGELVNFFQLRIEITLSSLEHTDLISNTQTPPTCVCVSVCE